MGPSYAVSGLLLLLRMGAGAGASLPTQYSVRSKHGSMETLNQGTCGSCWSFAATSSVSDRFCLKGINVTISPQSPISCPECANNCNGGMEGHAFNFISSYGIQTCTNYCTSGCEPYRSAAKPSTCTDDVDKDYCQKCDKQCHNGATAKRYYVDISTHKVATLDGSTYETAIMNEIYAHGSVCTTMPVFKNWNGWVKNHGAAAVYDTHEGTTYIGGHSIKIIGWGVSNNKKYWLVQNSWGHNWGDAGTIKMLRGQSASVTGNDRMFGTSATWVQVKTTLSGESESVASFSSYSDAIANSTITGGWSEVDHTHSFWTGVAQKVFALSGAEGNFEYLEKVESQVVAGFNARFTARTKHGFRAVISSSHGVEDELVHAPVLESFVALAADSA